MDELVSKAIAGDVQSEKQLFDELLERFRYLAKRRVGEEHCDDLVQEACVTVFEKYKTEEFSISFIAWAHGVLRMKIGNHLQRKTRMQGRDFELNEETDMAAATREVDVDLKRFLLECLRRIIKTGGNYARILNLAHQGLTTEEICSRVGVKPNNYYVTLNRGRGMLKECMQGKGAMA